MFLSVRALRFTNRSLAVRLFSQQTNQNEPSKPNMNVAGLSENCVAVPAQPVGAVGAAKDKEYKNPEYFCYHVDSFAEAEVELAKFRLPPPSNKRKFGQ
ncbi:NADH:ubiquinone oxidoreductase subunit V3 [Cotesia typhae]|uniref:NADH:ubiquinone oxidoreductase subunit V3 n=1 Tax=Cotesia typhae TaxID=2053667 RepID=UPI003D69E8F3